LLARGSRLTELLKQPQFKPVPIEEQVVAIFAGVRGYLDKIDLGRVGAFESQMLSEMKSREPTILEAIRTDLEIKPDTEKKLTGFMDNFSKSFS
jgi:F-type H+/Na+-transporting ATPase subunit alpha